MEETRIDNLLVISPHYHTFIKGLTNACARYARNIDVFVNHNHLSEIARFLPSTPRISWIRKFSKDSLIDSTNIPDNVKCDIESMLYFVPDGWNQTLGRKIASKIEKSINKSSMKPDVIHSHFILPCGQAGAELKNRIQKPLIVTGHGHDVYEMPFRDDEWRHRVKEVLDSADHIIVVSILNRERILQIKGNAKISVIPNGCQIKQFHPMDKSHCRKTLKIQSDTNMLLTVGNLSAVKGHVYLIRALKEISDIIKKRIDCYIIGDGIMRKELLNLVRDEDLDDIVHFMGDISHDKIPLWMNASDVFVLPSLNEGNPTVLFECLGCGTPFIGTRVGGIPEIIQSDQYGLLCNPGDSSGLAKSISIALNRDWDRDSIAIYGRQFDWSNIAGRMMHIYEEFA